MLRQPGERASWQMEKSGKWLLGGAAIVGALALISGSRLQQFSKEFVLNTNLRVHKVDLSGIQLAIEITFKNPTDATLKLKHPFVSLFDSQANVDANLPLLSSTVSSKIYTIYPNTETKLDPVMLTIDLFDVQLVLAGRALVKNYLSGKAVTLYGRARTQINGTVPIVQTFQSTLQKSAKAQTVQGKTASK